MKRRLILFLMMLTVTASFAQFSGKGTGEYGNPYQVTTAAQLGELRNFLGPDNYVYVKLMNDIDLTDYIAQKYPYGGWSPIGSGIPDDYEGDYYYEDYEDVFHGTIYGNNKTIKGLKIHNNSDYLGLFGAFEGRIYDLTVEVDITNNYHNSSHAPEGKGNRVNREVPMGDYVGGLFGIAYNAYVSNCVVKGNVHGMEYVGGFCGYSYGGSFNNCTFESGSVDGGGEIGGFCGYSSGGSFNNCTFESGSVGGYGEIGGICGRGSANYDNCKVKADINGGSFSLGGICGWSEWGDINNCGYSGNINGDEYVGGIVGYLSDGTITSCWTSCHLTGLANHGGIVGKMEYGTIKNCRGNGSIKGFNNLGGIVGCIGNDLLYEDDYYHGYGQSSIEKCINQYMNLEGCSYVGGIVGLCNNIETTIKECEAFSGDIKGVRSEDDEVSADFYDCVGGLAGYFAGEMTDCFSYGMNVTGESYVGGLVGQFVGGKIRNSYARNRISGLEYVGGLCGEVKCNSSEKAIVESCFSSNYKIAFSGDTQHKGMAFGACNGSYSIPANTDSKANVSLRTTKQIVDGVAVTQFESNLLNGRDIAYSAATLERYYVSKGWDFTNIWMFDKNGPYFGFPNLRYVSPSAWSWVTTGFHLTSEPLVLNKQTGGTLKVTMSNSESIKDNIGVQFTLVLPAGVSIKKVSGAYDIKPLGKLDGHSIACNRLDDGSYKIMVFSVNMKRFNPAGDGLMSIGLEADDSAVPDIYDVFFNDVVFAQLKDGATVSTSYKDSGEIGMLEVIDGIRGDVDGDGEVTITDVMNLVNHILGMPVEPFYEHNADANEDGSVDVSDVMTCVMMILSNNNSVNSVNALLANTSLDKIEVVACDEGYDIHLDNLDHYTALQMNVKLPQGCKLKEAVLNPQRADGHSIATKQIEDGSWNIVVWSMEGNELVNDGTRLFTLVTEGKAEGKAQVDGILLTNKECDAIALQGVAGGTTGVKDVETANDKDVFYNLQGVKVKQPVKGVYVRNGKKVAIK